MKVELGAGARAADGYIALDINPQHANVVASAMALPFRDASIEAMRCVDVLEHISYRHTADALQEWARVMMRGAELFIQVPDAATIMRWFAAGDARLTRTDRPFVETHLAGAEWRLLGGHGDNRYVDDDGDWRWNAHYSLWDENSLKAAAACAGFRPISVRRNDHPNLQMKAVCECSL